MSTPTAAPKAPAAPTSNAPQKWAGSYRSYDLVKEFVVALVGVSLLTVALSALFSSPDESQITLGSWATASPNDFVLTAAAELDGTSGSATYGRPYTNDKSAAQKLGPIAPQNWFGVTIPVDSAQDFVRSPLGGLPGDPALKAALTTFDAAHPNQQLAWATNYDQALQKATDNDPAKVAAGDYGPVPVMLNRLLRMARNGGLDGALLVQSAFYASDYTKPLLFIADGSYLEEVASGQHLTGEQWGMMNETGNYPGQAWLWLYTFWYQVKPFSTSPNADTLVWVLMMVLSGVLIAVPFIPGLRDVPKKLGIYKLIWRDYYRAQRS